MKFDIKDDAIKIYDVNALDAYRIARQRSITFYQELPRHTDEESGQNALQELVAEEEKHQEKLSHLLKDIQ